jgi:hypothetical protein
MEKHAMGIIVNWYAPQTNVINLTIEGKWTWDELSSAMRTAHEMLDTTQYDFVDYILDMRKGDTLPSNIMSRMKTFTQNQHRKSRNMVVVGPGSFVITLFNLMTRVAPQRMQHIKLVKTMEEALYHLNVSDEMVLAGR